MRHQIQIPNHQAELLDIWVEGWKQANRLLLLVHGFGTNKHEHGLFDAIVKELSEAVLTVRFDFSGYGQSQGKQVDVSYAKQTKDLHAVLSWINKTYPQSEKNLLAMSMGCYIVAMLKPQNIAKTLLLSIPHRSTHALKQVIKQRIISKGGTVDESGISTYPRTHGEDQQIGPGFWQVMDQLDPVKEVEQLSHLTDLLIIHPKGDEIVATKHINKYQEISTARYLEIPGDHSFYQSPDRSNLTQVLKAFLT
jgi:pimeloyl-ACP methyl ester carboxylesterase